MLSGRELWNANRRAKYAAVQVWYEFRCEGCGTTVQASGQKKRRFCSRKCKTDVHNREWQAANGDKIRAYERSPERRAMARRSSAAYYANNRAYVRARDDAKYQATRRDTPWLALVNGARSRAKSKGITFDLTPEWAESRWTGRCELSDIPFVCGQPKTTSRLFWPSIDRIKPEHGYTQDNCRFVLHAINALKGEGSDNDMMLIVSALSSKLRMERQ